MKYDKESEFLSKCIDERNLIFLGLCFIAHIIFALIYHHIGITYMVSINFVCICFLIYEMLIIRSHSINVILWVYAEIIMFSSLSSYIVGIQAGFWVHIIGVLTVIFNLTYELGHKRFMIQGSGAVALLGTYVLCWINPNAFSRAKNLMMPYNQTMLFINIVYVIVLVVIVSFLYSKDLDRMYATLEYRARHDELTGLMNRRYMFEWLRKEANARKTHSPYVYENMVVCMCDIDNFKMLNDTYGHDRGDIILKGFADIMMDKLKNFKVARWGGEEFLIVAKNMDRGKAYELIEQFHKEIAKARFVSNDITLSATMTVGMVTAEKTTNIESMIIKADEMLYKGKQSGKNCIVK